MNPVQPSPAFYGPKPRPIFLAAAAGLIFCLATTAWPVTPAEFGVPTPPSGLPSPKLPFVGKHRSPVDLILTKDERWILTVNQTSDSVAVVERATGNVVHEVVTGHRPSALALSPDEKTVLVTGTFSGDLRIFHFAEGKLSQTGAVQLGFEPRGVVISPDGKLAYVALTTAKQIAVVDLAKKKKIDAITVGSWPRYLALTSDGKKLAVGINGEGGVAVVDTHDRASLYLEPFSAINLGQVHISKDDKFAYLPWMVYRTNPITPNNIRIGWVLATRIARINLNEHVRREAIALDAKGEAVADPHGLALSPDEQWMVCAASGTHELLGFKMDGLPFQDYGGPGDHIDAKLLKDEGRFFRIKLGGRPMAVRFSNDGKLVYVANYLLDAIQVVEMKSRQVVNTIKLGGPVDAAANPLPPSLARQGEEIFYDGKRSLDQWYSCHSCHYEGHVNAPTMDTLNDGSFGSFKTVLSLRNVTRTGPWTWHGWQKDLRAAMKKSITDTMLGKAPTEADIDAMIAFLDTLEVPRNPHLNPDGTMTEAAQRGQKIFKGDKAGCWRCHSGPYFTDGKIHNVGTNGKYDVYKGYNPPSLLGVYDRFKFLHDGRAASLEALLTGPHNPAQVLGHKEQLTEQELKDLVEYVKSL